MIGRFFEWLLNLAAIALLVAFVLLALHAANPRQAVLGAFSRSAPEEAAFLDRTGGGDPSPPSAPGLFMALDQEAGDTKADGADGYPGVSASSADLDLRDFALPTPLAGFGGLHPIAESWYRGVAAGIASWMGEGYGAGYLALPIGPGFRVRLCGAGGCVEMVSNDAGPDLAMQRRGRIADIAVVVWERITGLPRRLGLAQITLTVIGRTP